MKLQFITKLTKHINVRNIKYMFQRLIRGWDDSDTWELDRVLSKIIVPRLIRYKELYSGTPSGISAKEWESILDEMIWGFKWFSIYHPMNSSYNSEYSRAKAAIKLFAHHFDDLWW